jgi:hypothetical protein
MATQKQLKALAEGRKKLAAKRKRSTTKKTTKKGLSGATRKTTRKRSVKVQVERRARKQDREFYGEPDFYYDWEREEAIVEGYSEERYAAAKRFANLNLKSELPNGFRIVSDHFAHGKWHFIVSTKKGLNGTANKGRAPRVKTMTTAEGKRWNISDYPNFSKTGSVTGMRKKYYGKRALLVRCGDYIYNVTSAPEIYNAAK